MSLKAKLFFLLFVAAGGFSLWAQQGKLPIPEINVGLAYGIPDFSIQNEVSGVLFLSCNKPTHTYVSPYLDFRYMNLTTPRYGIGIKSGLQGWKADYGLNTVYMEATGTPLPCSISNFCSDFGPTAYLRYGRLTFTQSVTGVISSLTFRVKDLENKWYSDNMLMMGVSGESGLELRVSKNSSINIGCQKQVFAGKKFVFTPDLGLDLTGKFRKPVTIYKMGLTINQDGVTKMKEIWKKKVLEHRV